MLEKKTKRTSVNGLRARQNRLIDKTTILDNKRQNIINNFNWWVAIVQTNEMSNFGLERTNCLSYNKQGLGILDGDSILLLITTE